MGCPPVRGDNPRALASGLSYVQVDKYGRLFYATYISVDLAHPEIYRAKVGKGGIKTGCLWYENNICIQSVKVNNLENTGSSCKMVLTDTMAFIPNGVKNLKRHSFANISEAWRGLGNREATQGRLSLAFGPSLGKLSERNTYFESVTLAVIQLFQKKELQENELHNVQENIRHLNKDTGPLIYDYYKDKLMKKGMVILREAVKRETGINLLSKLGEQWDFFYQEILPALQAMLHPVKTNNYTIKQITLLEFRNTVLLKLPIAAAIDGLADNDPIPPAIQQMLLVLQGVHETPCSDAYLQLEKLVARVVSPYLGILGVYNGNKEPEIRSNFKLPPQIYILEPTECGKSKSEEDLSHPIDIRTKRHKLSPLLLGQKLSPKHTSLLQNHFLSTVKEQDAIRRHSIDTT